MTTLTIPYQINKLDDEAPIAPGYKPEAKIAMEEFLEAFEADYVPDDEEIRECLFSYAAADFEDKVGPTVDHAVLNALVLQVKAALEARK